jgi:hypothetical protein
MQMGTPCPDFKKKQRLSTSAIKFHYSGAPSIFVIPAKAGIPMFWNHLF